MVSWTSDALYSHLQVFVSVFLFTLSLLTLLSHSSAKDWSGNWTDMWAGPSPLHRRIGLCNLLSSVLHIKSQWW
jgi:hypothetical protein